MHEYEGTVIRTDQLHIVCKSKTEHTFTMASILSIQEEGKDHDEFITPYSSIKSERNFVSATTDVEGCDPSESEEADTMVSRSSKMTREGAWSNASDMEAERVWRMAEALSKVSPEQLTKTLHAQN